MAANEQATPWPDGVIARYLTVGGATVDVIPDGPGQITSAKCTACPYSGWEVWTTDNGRYAETEARRLAQSHAERCRAMPRPEVA